jgi:hypothetical protein
MPQGTKQGNPEEHLPPAHPSAQTAFSAERASVVAGLGTRDIAFSWPRASATRSSSTCATKDDPAADAGAVGRLPARPVPADGDYFLIGARTFTDIRTTRDRDQEMWLLARLGRPPIALGHKISEGVAISRKTKRSPGPTRTASTRPDPDGESVPLPGRHRRETVAPSSPTSWS